MKSSYLQGNFWEKDIAKSYQEYSLEKNSIYRQTNRYIATLLKDFKIESLIDIGCGSGLTTYYLLKTHNEIKKIYAVDLSQDMLLFYQKNLKKWFGKNTKKIKLVNSKIEDFKTNINFDAVISNSALYFTNLRVTLKKVYHLLNKGGVLLFTIFDQVNEDLNSKDSFYPLLSEKLKKYAIRNKLLFNDVFSKKWKKSQIEKYLEKTGFKKILIFEKTFRESLSTAYKALEHYSERLLYLTFPELPYRNSIKIVLDIGKKLISEEGYKRKIYFYIANKMR